MSRKSEELRKKISWQIKNGHLIKAADTDKKMGIPESAKRMMKHRPYGGTRNE